MKIGQTRRSINYRLVISFVLIALFVGWMMSLFQDIFLYVFISIVVAAIGRPFTVYFAKLGIGAGRWVRIASVLATFIILILTITFLVVIFAPLIRDQILFITSLDFSVIQSYIEVPIQKFERILLKYDLTTFEKEGFLVESFVQGFKNIIQKINYSILIGGLISFTGNLFTGVLVILFTSFFLLYEKGIISNTLLKVIPNSYFELVLSAYYRIQRLLSNYLLGLVLQMLAIFSFSALSLIIFNVEHALTIALFAAVSNLIPYAGPLLGAIFGIVTSTLTWVEMGGGESIFPVLFKIAIIFVVVQLLDNILIQPIVFSKIVKAHPLEIFVVVVAGASLGGIVGMVIAIPLYTALKVFIQETVKGFNQYRSFRY